MAESSQIQKMSHMHVAILDYMVANPKVKKGDVAKEFGVTGTWLSIVINSNAFQEMLRQRQNEFFGEVVVPIREKMLGIVDATLDRLAGKVELMETREALETADTLLHRLGFAPNTKVNGQDPRGQAGAAVVQNFFVGNDILQSARAKFGQSQEREVAPTQAEETGRELPAPEEVSSGRLDRVGHTVEGGTPVRHLDSESDRVVQEGTGL